MLNDTTSHPANKNTKKLSPNINVSSKYNPVKLVIVNNVIQYNSLIIKICKYTLIFKKNKKTKIFKIKMHLIRVYIQKLLNSKQLKKRKEVEISCGEVRTNPPSFFKNVHNLILGIAHGKTNHITLRHSENRCQVRFEFLYPTD